jgi:hypothetical protein
VRYESGDEDTWMHLTKGLPEELSYVGEFGPELIIFLPFCKWVSAAGLAAGRRISTYKGMTCFYDNLGFEQVIERPDARVYLQPEYRPAYLPRRDENTFDGLGQSAFHLNPNLRRKFESIPVPSIVRTAQRPILVIHNKYNDEWGRGPVNNMTLPLLSTLFEQLKEQFLVVYIRHANAKADGYAHDQNKLLDFDETEVLRGNAEVIPFDDLMAAFTAECGITNVNLAKAALYSRCFNFITSQGGGAHQIAHFSGSLVSILHRAGAEITWAYHLGYYNFMSNPAPTRMICINDGELVASVAAHLASTLHHGRLYVSDAGQKTVVALGPERWGAKFLSRRRE